eukprot:11215232-Karenia_brevis.AAC.1
MAAKAAATIAKAEGDSSVNSTPPPFVALNDMTSMKYIRQMNRFLDEAQWATCVVCWRAWYNVGTASTNFEGVRTKFQQSRAQPWFDPRRSEV